MNRLKNLSDMPPYEITFLRVSYEFPTNVLRTCSLVHCLLNLTPRSALNMMKTHNKYGSYWDTRAWGGWVGYSTAVGGWWDIAERQGMGAGGEYEIAKWPL